MRIALVAFLCFALLITNAPGVGAEGINLYWNDCSPFRGGAGVTGITNDCASNSGSLVLVGSVVPPHGATGIIAMESELYVTSTAPVLPAWWQMQSAGCRAGSISVSTQFIGLSACANPWSSNALAANTYETGAPCCSSPNLARLRIAEAMPAADSVAMSTSLEYYAFEVLINRSKSIGTGSCEGCATATCIELRYIQLDQLTAPITFGAISRVEQNRFVTYNGAQANNCVGFTPVRNRTWGAVKAMYR
jgi:hypothetical protein